MKTRTFLIILIVFALLLVGVYLVYTQIFDNLDSNLHEPKLINNSQTEINISPEVIVVENLEIPWEITFLNEKTFLITERPGRLLIVDNNLSPLEIKNVKHIGEGGLLGLATHPDFENNDYLYLYQTTEVDGKIENQVVRYTFAQNELSNKTIIFGGIQGSSVHDGGRIKFGPDDKLYITTGDAGNEQTAQDRDSLNGKILRINDDGSIPEDNPFGTAVWSYGHRNPQGLTWDNEGRLWATEHGRSGIQSGYDELNLIEKGKNYGWPVIQGQEEKDGMEAPVIQSGPDTTWAPAGAAHYNGSIYFAGLRGKTLYEYNISEDILTEHLVDKYGRLRAVAVQNEFLYISTSNRDGRGAPATQDDRIIRVDPEQL